MDEAAKLAFAYGRRFGVEIELNAFDNRDFRANPLRKGELPEGVHYIGALITSLLGVSVEICKWHHTHNNNNWVIKPDSSCGIEVCSPVAKGWSGLKQICMVIEAFRKDPLIKADGRCSLHVHMDMSDLNADQLGTVLAYWIKSEGVFLDSVPENRKRNRYCQCIGLCDIFDHDKNVTPRDIVQILGRQKYFTINTYHYCQGKRLSMEFRIVEAEGCKDPYLVKNWIRLLVHFVEVAKRHPMPSPYNPEDKWSGLLWLDPEDVLGFLGFLGSYELSKGMEQTRNWFLGRLKANLPGNGKGLEGIWSKDARQIAIQQIDKIVSRLGLEEKIQECLHPTDAEDKLFSVDYRS